MIYFSKHALIKLRQRKISKNLVFATLRKPDYNRPSYGGRVAFLRKFGDLYFKVVCTKKGNIVVIITQHWVRKIK